LANREMSMLREGTDIFIALNIDAFSPEDGRALEDRLRAESDLRIKSAILAADTAPGGIPPPDVTIYLLETVAPIVKDVIVGLLAAALWDVIKDASSRRRREDPETTVAIVEEDERGRTLRKNDGKISDSETIEELIGEALEDDEA